MRHFRTSLLLLLFLLLAGCANLDSDNRPRLFVDEQPPIHPTLIRHFSILLSDLGPPAVHVVNVSASFNLDNQYFVDDIKQRGKLLFIEDDPEGRAWFGYEHLGTMQGGVHVLKTFDCGGGSGAFMDLLFLQENQAPNGDLLLSYVGSQVLGDSSSATVVVLPDRVTIDGDEVYFVD